MTYFPEFGIEIEECKELKNNAERTVYSGLFEGKKVVAKMASQASKETMDQEAKNLRNLQGPDLDFGAPAVIRDSARILIMQFTEGSEKSKLTLKDYKLAADYLVRLHSLIPSKLKDQDLQRIYCGYNLRQRLNEEASFMQLAKNRIGGEYPKLQGVFNQVLQIADQACNEKYVIGHGDFKADNLIFSGERIFPVDWRDFGFAAREYDIGSLLFMEENHDILKQVVDYYINQPGFSEGHNERASENFLRRSLSVAYVIMSGSHFHNIVRGDDIQSNLKTIEEYADFVTRQLKL